MARMPLSEFQERLNVAQDMLREAYPDNPAVEQMCEAITTAALVVMHVSLPFQKIVEEKLDINK